MSQIQEGPATYPLRWAVRSREEFNQEDLPVMTVTSEFGVAVRDMEAGGRAVSEDLSGYRVVAPCDLVVNRLWARFGAYGVSRDHGIISPAYWVLVVALDLLEPRFLHYLLRSDPYRAEIGRISKNQPPNGFDLPWELFRALPVPQVELGEQRRIADFLDDQVTRIDNIIAARQQQIARFASEFSSLGDRLITGSSQEGPLVPADWKPFGEVPASWRQTRLGSIPCVIQTGPFGSQLHSYEYVDGGWPVVNPSSLNDSRIIPVQGMAVSDAVRARLARHQLRVGDVVFGRRGEMGRAGLVTEAEKGWLLGTGSLMVRLGIGSDLRANYLMRLLETGPLRFYFDSQAVGSTMANLNTPILASMPVLLPTFAEQSTLVAGFGLLEDHYRGLQAAVARSIDLLRELKRSLISAAVSGEFDVTTSSGRGVQS